jgi:hypothetical protein
MVSGFFTPEAGGKQAEMLASSFYRAHLSINVLIKFFLMTSS